MTAAATDVSTQQTLIDALASRGSTERIETHISCVLLSGERALKIKKAVNLGFLDFTTLARRRFYCEREVELNRPLAPSLYLGVIPITGTPDAPRIGGDGPAIEYAVEMRRFPQEALLTHVLATGRLTAAHVDQLAEEVAAFHLSTGRASGDATYGSVDQVLALAIENFTEIAPLLSGHADRLALEALRRWTASELAAHRDAVVRRHQTGFVRACHADLHLGNIVLIDDRPTLFDCVEFNEAIRWSDVMADVGFLTMDLIDRGRPAFASRFLNRYLERTGDYDGIRVLRFYAVYRAMVRAKVAIMRAAQLDEPAERRLAVRDYRQYTRLARRLTRSIDGGVIITQGPTASGKTTATETLVEDLHAVRVRTDVERKRLHQLAADARTDSVLNGGIYSPDDTRRTYDALAAIVRTIVASGYVAIADGTFLRRGHRDAFVAIARDLHVPFVILRFVVDPDVLAARVEQRRLRGGDASEADAAVLRHQLESAEPLGPDEQRHTLTCENRENV